MKIKNSLDCGNEPRWGRHVLKHIAPGVTQLDFFFLIAKQTPSVKNLTPLDNLQILGSQLNISRRD